MKYLILTLSFSFHFFSFSQTKKVKIIDSVYTNSIIELTYVGGVPSGEYFCWFIDGHLKEKGLIDNSNINLDSTYYYEKNTNYIDSFYKAKNHYNDVDTNLTIFATTTGNNHRYINFVNYKDTLNKVVYDYKNSFKFFREKYIVQHGKSQITNKDFLKIYKNEKLIYITKIDTMLSYREDGSLDYKIICELISTFKTSKVWAEKIITYGKKANIIEENISYYETKNNIVRNLTVMKNISYLKEKKTIKYYVVDSWNNKIKI